MGASRFDLPAFYAEARRVLRPGGTLAIWGYDRPFIDSDDKADALVLKLYEGTLGSYWDARRHHIDEHLRGKNSTHADRSRQC